MFPQIPQIFPHAVKHCKKLHLFLAIYFSKSVFKNVFEMKLNEQFQRNKID